MEHDAKCLLLTSGINLQLAKTKRIVQVRIEQVGGALSEAKLSSLSG